MEVCKVSQLSESSESLVHVCTRMCVCTPHILSMLETCILYIYVFLKLVRGKIIAL